MLELCCGFGWGPGRAVSGASSCLLVAQVGTLPIKHRKNLKSLMRPLCLRVGGYRGGRGERSGGVKGVAGGPEMWGHPVVTGPRCGTKLWASSQYLVSYIHLHARSAAQRTRELLLCHIEQCSMFTAFISSHPPAPFLSSHTRTHARTRAHLHTNASLPFGRHLSLSRFQLPLGPTPQGSPSRTYTLPFCLEPRLTWTSRAYITWAL